MKDINGNPYTTAAEDIRCMELTAAFRQALAFEVTSAMQKVVKGKPMQIEMRPLEQFITQAYLMGREDGAGK